MMYIVFLFLGILQLSSQAETGPWTKVDLCGPIGNNAANSFISVLQLIVQSSLRDGVNFARKHQTDTKADFLHDINSSQYAVLQLLQGLVSGDEVIVKLVLSMTNNIREKELPELTSWLSDTFRLEKTELHRALKNYIKWGSDRNMNILMVQLAERYSLVDFIKSQNDNDTLGWITKIENEIKETGPKVTVGDRP